ncbi:hypothetical protein [Pseudonocardia nigra]|uniref:hypothetical protein n=1 Tax=Pseudonocardia nigra TaxID=1921578 RepID=UPI001C5F09B5|nr:hypothetical protein [Pseudonocardia nigra]
MIQPEQARAGGARRCTVPGCGRDHKAHGYCRTHYRRWQRHGEPLAAVPIADTGTSYRAALTQLRASRGAPDAQRCADCAGLAAVWAYDGTDPDERTEPGRGRRYSLDPARYRPLCRFCHRRAVLDRAAPVPEARRGAPALDVDRAVRLYAAGASAAGIAALLRVSPDAVLRALRAREVVIRPARPNNSRAF